MPNVRASSDVRPSCAHGKGVEIQTFSGAPAKQGQQSEADEACNQYNHKVSTRVGYVRVWDQGHGCCKHDYTMHLTGCCKHGDTMHQPGRCMQRGTMHQTGRCMLRGTMH